ncbi:helix-turn-helix domain-containing protein [Paenibacillus sp. MMS20-IR301]|uniref:helix-turn-helix domain-containing protein n=1 Tax=Paenibacillus sp. MMS20-IR301 TaxID=2895946 RepID=UPI0028EB0FF4|nr:helix-turn-helix domain-containing protein [Paenibacillus sp. MMS20-IR301]WNS41901.1 helix-turn-helix domain-containing protein [Paenibacillus sp. MMS20-IR301]
MKTNAEELLLTMVVKAQAGDREALQQILNRFKPFIQRVACTASVNERDDLEQDLTEMLIKKIMNYPLNSAPDYSSFCGMLYKDT